MSKEHLWESHRDAWALCMRCPLSEWRGLSDPGRNKSPTLVPMGLSLGEADGDLPKPRPVVLMISFPDATQEEAQGLFGDGGGSPTLRALRMALDSLGDHSPFAWEGLGLISALGCRPADFNSSRKNRQVTTSMVGPCMSRWQLELLLMDPVLLITLGHGAFAATHPKTPKTSEFHANLGEVRRIFVPGPQGTRLPFDMYVAPDVLQAAEQGTASQWAREFPFAPPMRPSLEPVDFFRWHLYRALVVAEQLQRNQTGLDPSPEWGRMLQAQKAFHESRYSVQEALDENALWAASVSVQERGMRNVRRALLFDDVDETIAPGESLTLDDEDDTTPYEDEDEEDAHADED